jgi:hypothetical protein
MYYASFKYYFLARYVVLKIKKYYLYDDKAFKTTSNLFFLVVCKLRQIERSLQSTILKLRIVYLLMIKYIIGTFFCSVEQNDCHLVTFALPL